jgi:hypothetical protein
MVIPSRWKAALGAAERSAEAREEFVRKHQVAAASPRSAIALKVECKLVDLSW